MAYRIRYGPMKENNNGKRNILIWIVAILLLTGVYFVKKSTISFLPGDPGVTAAALENMAASVAEGESVGDAFFCFCREIIDGAGLSY